jgi:hypothetical protein
VNNENATFDFGHVEWCVEEFDGYSLQISTKTKSYNQYVE